MDIVEHQGFVQAQDVALFGDNIIEFNGQKFTPDESKGYFQFQISSAFPHGATTRGTALHPAVIAASYQSMKDQMLNREHRVAAYHKKPGQPVPVEDWVIGAVEAVHFPNPQGGRWTISTQSSPSVSGVAVYWKAVSAMNKIIGDHMAGRHKYTVSMEVKYDVNASGFAVASKPGDKAFKPSFSSTPDDFGKAGFDYVPYADAPDELRSTYSFKNGGHIVKQYKGRNAFMMMGGINGTVHYCGMGLVKYGAEKTASITRMTASDVDSWVTPFAGFADLLDELAKKVQKKS